MTKFRRYRRCARQLFVIVPQPGGGYAVPEALDEDYSTVYPLSVHEVLQWCRGSSTGDKLDEAHAPYYFMGWMAGLKRDAQQTARTMEAFEPVLRETRPDWVVRFSVRDERSSRTTTFSCSMRRRACTPTPRSRRVESRS